MDERDSDSKGHVYNCISESVKATLCDNVAGTHTLRKEPPAYGNREVYESDHDNTPFAYGMLKTWSLILSTMSVCIKGSKRAKSRRSKHTLSE